MLKYALLLLAAVTLSGCYTTGYQSAAAGGTAPALKDVRVQLDDGRIQTYATDYDLRRGDRVQVLADGKVAPL
jgi:hypothetical protein